MMIGPKMRPLEVCSVVDLRDSGLTHGLFARVLSDALDRWNLRMPADRGLCGFLSEVTVRALQEPGFWQYTTRDYARDMIRRNLGLRRNSRLVDWSGDRGKQIQLSSVAAHAMIAPPRGSINGTKFRRDLIGRLISHNKSFDAEWLVGYTEHYYVDLGLVDWGPYESVEIVT